MTSTLCILDLNPPLTTPAQVLDLVHVERIATPHRSASKLFSASQPSAPHDANPFMDEGVAARCDAAPREER